MKYVDYTSLFSGEPAELALLSTYNFDADFFERRVLRLPALARARRVAVFVDAGQWGRVRPDSITARWVNQKYLVVPVSVPNGVFHPKLHVMVAENGARVVCGSSNLTRSGCTHNLELVNSVPVSADSGTGSRRLVRDTLSFFDQAAASGRDKTAGIAERWLHELKRDLPWVEAVDESAPMGDGPLLLHTLDGPLWPRLVTAVGEKPRRLMVISPFYDRDGSLLKRVCKQWPDAEIEVVAQQTTSNLPVGRLQSVEDRLRLYEVQATARRLHGKLMAWDSGRGSGALVGSANFTAAAFDGRNVEACLLLPEQYAEAAALFDDELPRRVVPLDAFVPAEVSEPEPEPDELSGPTLRTAILNLDQTLVVQVRGEAAEGASVSIALRAGGESDPRWTGELLRLKGGEAHLSVSESALQDLHGAMLATLVVLRGGVREEGQAVWVVQEAKLTHEYGEGATSRSSNQVKETGDGLPEYLDELGARSGVAGMVDYLNHLNIRFIDRAGRPGGMGSFKLRRSDPFHPDIPPEWWDEVDPHADNLEAAIYDFCERHDMRRLRKHATRGNLNGLENFLDIFSAIVRLLYVYMHRPGRGSQMVVKKPRFIGRVCRLIEVATIGVDQRKEKCPGYLMTLHEHLRGDPDLLRKRLTEVNFGGQIVAALLLAQFARFDPNEMRHRGNVASGPGVCLPAQSVAVIDGLAMVDIQATADQVRQVLEQYNMITHGEISVYFEEFSVHQREVS